MSPLFTLAGAECNPAVFSNKAGFFDWPSQSFHVGGADAIALTVAATDNTSIDHGGLSPVSNYGPLFEVAAPGNWAGLVDDSGGATVAGSGGSFAAAAVAGVAGLVQAISIDPRFPRGAALKERLLFGHTTVDRRLDGEIDGSRVITLKNIGDDAERRFSAVEPVACSSGFEHIDFPFVARASGAGTVWDWDIPVDPNCFSAAYMETYGGPCPHYSNNVDYARRILGNQYVSQLDLHFESFDTEPAAPDLRSGDYLGFGRECY